MEGREKVDILELFKQNKFLKICAPMVRYSKLEFRTLVRKYGCDMCFTPMIMADSFVQSIKARNNEFTTNKDDKPLIVQLAANNPVDFTNAAELVSPFCDGVDLNCGCPQKWAMNDGYGAELLLHPEKIKDMVQQVRRRISNNFSVSVKIRLLSDLRNTIQLCRDLAVAGATFLTVHGRSVSERCEPVHYDELKEIVKSVDVPVVANGDVKSLDDALQMQELTNCQGVMAARGILQNPAMYTGCDVTPLKCVQDWVDISAKSRVYFQCFHHHLVFMLEKVLNKKDRKVFNHLNTYDKVTGFLEEKLNINIPVYSSCESIPIKYSDELGGSYFKSKVCETDQDDIEEYIGDFCANIYNI